MFSLFEKTPPFTLPWSHYLQLIRIKDENERSFYEIEATQGAWSVRVLQRQYNSSLYERLALSRDKDEVEKLAAEGNVIIKPSDIVKQPTVLEFLGLEEQASYSEGDLESVLIDKLTHQDLGQMQMYVNYYDRYQKLSDENPTVGILLCKEKDDALVEITLPENSNIFATQYELYLPDKMVLQKKLKQWIAEETEGEKI